MFAMFGCLPRPFVMEGVGQRNINRLDFGIVQQLLIASIRHRNVCLGRCRLGTLQRPAGNCSQLSVLRLGKRRQQPLSDVGNSENSPMLFCCFVSHFLICSLFVVRCSLFVVRCSLFVVRCSLWPSFPCCRSSLDPTDPIEHGHTVQWLQQGCHVQLTTNNELINVPP